MKSILKNSNGNAVSTNGKLFTVSANYTDQIKQALIDKGVADEDTPNSELAGKIASISPLKTLLDNTKSCYYLFQNYNDESVEHLIKYDDTENVETMACMFRGSRVNEIPKLNMKSCKNMEYMFQSSSIKVLRELDTPNVTNMYGLLYSCGGVTDVLLLNMINVTNADVMFNYCNALINLNLKNIKVKLSLGDCKKLGLESLINTIKELVNVGSSKTLTMGSANLEKIANVYVRRTTEGDIPTCLSDNSNIDLAKAPCEVCESTDEGAMLITAYANSKNWTLA